ncbi:MAG: alpha/beta hydrolase-fold protein [Mycobacterium sp.]
MQGWLPVAVQILAVVALLCAIGWRSRRWRTGWLPVSVLLGVLTSVVAQWIFRSLGIASEPAPWLLWLWVALTGTAAAVAVAGWAGAGWSRRNVSIFAASMCLLSTGLVVNGWIGYFPTVYTAWNQLTDGPLPNQTDWAGVVELQRGGAQPSTGVLLPVTIGAEASQFPHREEYVYLPPVWFTSNPPPQLPVVMMIGGQFNTPADWVRAGDAVATLDAFAQAHAGNAPVAVFVDSTGTFGNDTECVNGPRGNAADHLTQDVVPFMTEHFGVSSDQTHWGVAGFSSGGTCALNLTVMHPDMFSAFLDIAGDLGPNAGTKAQTIDRLFGGDAEAWAAFDPATVIEKRGTYDGVAGLFVVPGAGPGGSDSYRLAASTLAELGNAHGIRSSVSALPGRHVWPFASTAFAAALPWLAGELDTPGTPPSAVPRSTT